MIVVSDTSPICYLLLIDQIMILQKLYELVVIPEAVADELKASESPSIVRNWIANPLIMYLLGERSSPLHCGQNPLL
ncbi:MAG: hypothetical protein IM507_03890 [Microcystis sp. M20BS1]|uniref:hypothetical protein n=1 Tax=Microcystis TaxID=1125 RepID=UPI000F4492C2|nr:MULTISPECIES: hypothetical protein [Microcystis]MCA2623292.1 hypothetical protein [Microcystis sp. M19BS1]MCA2631557.1 hypothetical protein [Microcystis sp. M20BS1]ROI07495.1 hypothetical protein ED562_07685 [Microcystis aeruginosa FACHB-524]